MVTVWVLVCKVSAVGRRQPNERAHLSKVGLQHNMAVWKCKLISWLCVSKESVLPRMMYFPVVLQIIPYTRTWCCKLQLWILIEHGRLAYFVKDLWFYCLCMKCWHVRNINHYWFGSVRYASLWSSIHKENQIFCNCVCLRDGSMEENINSLWNTYTI
jgi:hypothetical protein